MEGILIASSVVTWLVLLMNLALTLALIRRQNRIQPNREELLVVGQPAPTFVAETLRGSIVTLQDYEGSMAAFLFISPHCGPCRESLPRYEALWPTAQRAGVKLALVSLAGMEETRALVEEYKLTVPILVAPQFENAFSKDYKADSTPSYCVIDAEGKVQSVGYPSFDWGEWKSLVEGWNTQSLRVGELLSA